MFRNFAVFTGKLLSWSLFLIKRDSNTRLFLWILQDFSENLFWKTSANNCFYELLLTFCIFKNSTSLFCYYFLDLLDYYLWIKNGVITPLHKQLCFHDRITNFINTDLFIISCCLHCSNINNKFFEFLQSVSLM